jgi:benzoyl-CoA reductase/2-hydroxyglutaryl-CoA dehydratase subunit BcrC/BadD/HgdB
LKALMAKKSAAQRPYRKLESEARVKQMMKRYYLWTKLGPKLGFKTAWVTSGCPVEVPLSMGVIPQYPENFGALCGARKVGVELCQVAEARGYSPDLCSYARNSLGSVFAPDRAPLKGLSRPDVLIAGNNICGTVTKWWEHLGHHLKVPVFLFDTPFTRGQRPPHMLRYAERQVEELIAFLERHLRRSFSERAFRRVVERSAEAITLWNECLDMCTASPAPLNAADRFLAMAPVVTLRGTRSAVGYYRLLKREVIRRLEAGKGAIRRERRRLLWDNIAIWYDLYSFFNRFAEAGVSFPVDTYTSAWSGSIDVNDQPAEGVAKIYSSIYLNVDMEAKVARMQRMIERFDLDGFVLHSNRSCKPYSLGSQVIHSELVQRTGKPGLLIEADMVDERVYDQKRVHGQVASFLEVLG